MRHLRSALAILRGGRTGSRLAIARAGRRASRSRSARVRDALVELDAALGEAVPRVASRTCRAAFAPRRARSPGARRPARSRRRAPSSSSGGTSQPSGSPGTTLTKLGGPPLSVPITGRPHDIASRKTSPNGSAVDGATKQSAQARPSGSSPWPRQPAKKTPSTPSSVDDGVRVLALPLPGRPAPDHERRRHRHARAGARVGAHEQRHALERRGSARRRSAPAARSPVAGSKNASQRPGARSSGCCPARRSRPSPADRATSHSSQRARRSSARGAADREARDVDAVRQPVHGLGIDAEQADRLARAGTARSRSSRPRRAPTRPCAPPTSRRAGRARRPASAIACSIFSSVPCRCVTIGTRGQHGRRRLVDRRQVVQVQHRRRAAARASRRSAAPRPRPSALPARARRG